MSLSHQNTLTDPITVSGNTAQTEPENRVFFPALDGLRAIAFLMVFLQHYVQIPWGWTGVDLFFVLSGFLITGILFDTRDDQFRVRNFYIRRTLRIFPLYYTTLFFLLALQPFLHWSLSWGFLTWPAYVGNFARFIHPSSLGELQQLLGDFQLQGSLGGHAIVLYLGHFWSLCLEEQFYLVWPWLVFLIRDRQKLAWICAITVPVCLGLRIAGQHFFPQWMLNNEILYRATPLRMDALLLGGFLALALRGPYREATFSFGRKALPIVLAVVFLWLLFTPTGHLWQRPYVYPDWKFTWGLSAWDLLSALLILVAIQPRSITYRALGIRPLRWLGRMSYGAYILHDIPHALYNQAASRLVSHLPFEQRFSEHIRQYQSTLLTAVIAFFSTLVLAWLSYRFLESPFLNLKERFTFRGAETAPAVRPADAAPVEGSAL